MGECVAGRPHTDNEDVLTIVDEEDLPKELQDFVMEQAKTLVQPELLAEVPDDDVVVNSPFFYQELLDLWPSLSREIRMECMHELAGDLAGENPSLENTTIVGRSILSDFEGQELEYNVFFEFYKLKGIENEEQRKCFEDAVNRVFLEDSIPLTTEEQDFARSVIKEEADLLATRWMNIMNETRESMYSGSIYMEHGNITHL